MTMLGTTISDFDNLSFEEQDRLALDDFKNCIKKLKEQVL
jgi:hypothetical protein